MGAAEWCIERVQSKRFEPLSGYIIVFASLLVWIEIDNTGLVEKYHMAFKILDVLVVALFAVEIVIRFGATAWSLKEYRRDPWNWFDVGITLVTGFFELPLPIPQTNLVAIVRVVRLLRLIRGLRSFRSLRLMVNTLFRSLGYVGGAGVLLFGTLFLYGAAGVVLFAQHDPIHFSSVPVSVVALFGASAGGWLEMMDKLQPSVGMVAYLYFPTFGAVATVLLYNLVIGAVVRAVDEEAAASGGGNMETLLKELREELAANRLEREALRREIEALTAQRRLP